MLQLPGGATQDGRGVAVGGSMVGSEQADLFSAIGLRGAEAKAASQGAERSDGVGGTPKFRM